MSGKQANLETKEHGRLTKAQSSEKRLVELQEKRKRLIERSTELAVRLHRQAFEDLEKY